MPKVIHSENLKRALEARGWTKRDLAAELGVTAQAVTKWMQGVDFPRPDKLLRMAVILQLHFAELVEVSAKDQPIIAYRRKGGAR